MGLRPPSVLADALRANPTSGQSVCLLKSAAGSPSRRGALVRFTSNLRRLSEFLISRKRRDLSDIEIQSEVIVEDYLLTAEEKNMCREFRLLLLSGLLLMFSSDLATATISAEGTFDFETVHTSNAAVLNRLGLTPLQIPDGHHKKRLAGPEPPRLGSQTRIHQPYSRRHSHRDSHIYIVKLPASPPYYTITKPHKSVNDDKVTKTGPSFPVGFQGNGKPAKIYHWNLPVVKKITEKKRLQLSQLMIDQARRREDAKKRQKTSSSANQFYPLDATSKNNHIDDDKLRRGYEKPPVIKHVRNNDKRLTYPADNNNNDVKFELTKKSGDDKVYRLDDFNLHRIHLAGEFHGSKNTSSKMKKHRKKAAMSYYAPITTKTGSTSIHKNFPGNGKPKAFYIMEKSRKPVYYHPLLP